MGSPAQACTTFAPRSSLANGRVEAAASVPNLLDGKRSSNAPNLMQSGLLPDDMHSGPLKMLESIFEKNGYKRTVPPTVQCSPVVLAQEPLPSQRNLGLYIPEADTFTI